MQPLDFDPGGASSAGGGRGAGGASGDAAGGGSVESGTGAARAAATWASPAAGWDAGIVAFRGKRADWGGAGAEGETPGFGGAACRAG